MAEIDVLIENAIAVVTLNRPAKRNAMTLAMWRDVARIFAELGGDDSVRAVLLTGAGDDFSVGADVAEFDRVRGDVAQSVAYEEAVDAASHAIAAIPKPTIAVIAGYCLGGGCHLALACDFRFAGLSASFGIPAARLSIVYGLASTQRLYALVGLTQAKRILFSGQRFDAAAAVDIGFADAKADDPMQAARGFAGKLVENAPLSIAGAKFMLNGLAAGLGALDREGVQAVIDRASASADYAEGRRAFAEKRNPIFAGR